MKTKETSKDDEVTKGVITNATVTEVLADFIKKAGTEEIHTIAIAALSNDGKDTHFVIFGDADYENQLLGAATQLQTSVNALLPKMPKHP